MMGLAGRLLVLYGIALVAADHTSAWPASTLTDVIERHTRLVVATESRDVAGLRFTQGISPRLHVRPCRGRHGG